MEYSDDKSEFDHFGIADSLKKFQSFIFMYHGFTKPK